MPIENDKADVDSVDPESPDNNPSNEDSVPADHRFCLCGPKYDEQTIRANQILALNRFRTDYCGLFLFVAFTAFMVVLLVYAEMHSHVDQLTRGMDFRGEACGTGALSAYPHQAWTNPLTPNIKATAVCVPDCPAPANNSELDSSILVCVCNDKYWPKVFGIANLSDPNGLDNLGVETLVSQGSTRTLESQCKEEKNARRGYVEVKTFSNEEVLIHLAISVAQIGSSDPAAQPCAYVHRTALSMRKCAPWVSSTTLGQLVPKSTAPIDAHVDYVTQWLDENKQIMANMVVDAYWSIPILMVCCAAALPTAFIAMLGLVYATEFFVRFALFLVVVMLGLTDAVCWLRYEHYKDRADTVPPLASTLEDKTSCNVFFVLFIVSCCMTLIFLLLCLFARAKLARKKVDGGETSVPSETVSIIKAASSAFGTAPSLMFYPVLHTSFFIGVILLWLYGGIWIHSAGDIVVGANGVATWSHPWWLCVATALYIFGLLWWAGFATAMGYMIISGTIFLTSFASPKRRMRSERNIPHSAMTASACLVIQFHMGSAAMGSLVLLLMSPLRILLDTICKIRFFLPRVESDPQDVQHQSCYECFVRGNRMAFLMTVLHSYSFRSAGQHGLISVAENMEVIGESLYLSSFILTSIKLSIALGGAALSEALLATEYFGVTEDDFSYSWVMVLIVAFSLYVICGAFMVILEVAIESFLAGYCESTNDTLVDVGDVKECPESVLSDDDNHKYGDGGVRTEQIPKQLAEHIEIHNWSLKSYGHRNSDSSDERSPLVGKEHKRYSAESV